MNILPTSSHFISFFVLTSFDTQQIECKTIKYRKNQKEIGMDWWWCWEGTAFRVQCAFPNMETFAFLDEKQVLIRNFSEKNRSGGQDCCVMHSESRVDVQKRKFQWFMTKSEAKEHKDDYTCQSPTNRSLGGWWETWCTRNEECATRKMNWCVNTKTNTHTHNLNTHFLTIRAQGFKFEVSRCFIKYSDALS